MVEQGKITKRSMLGLAAGAAASSLGRPAIAQAPKTVKIGMVIPLSGPFATIGQTIKDGVDFAIQDVNDAGGIKSLGGAKFELVAADAEDSPEKARSAAQRLLSREPELIGGIGDALSAMTLVITELTERAELPWTTQTLADVLTERGFRNLFEVVNVSAVQAQLALPTVLGMAEAATGKRPATVSIVADTNAALQNILKLWRADEFEKNKLKVLSDRSYTPPLSDPTQLIEEFRRSRPDFAFLMATTVPDAKVLLDKLNEFGFGRGKLPSFAFAGISGAPDLLNTVGAQNLENFCGIFSHWPGKQQEELEQRFIARSGKPWMTGQVLEAYGQVMIYRDVLEKIGVADRRKVAEGIRTLDPNTPAASYFNSPLRWDERGRLIGAGMVVVQWQGGKPRAVYPPEVAVARPVWAGR